MVDELSSDDDLTELELWFAQAIRSTPSAPLPVPPKRPAERYWPAPASPKLQSGTIISKHPALDDLFVNVPEMRIGRSPRGARRGRPSRFPSWKAGRTMRLTSTLELDHVVDCELDGCVSRMVEQPVWLKYHNGIKAQRHKPDLYVVWQGNPEFREVKYEAQAAEPDNEARWPYIADAFNSLGFSYRVVTEATIREPTRHSTVWRIYEDRLAPLPPASNIYQLCNCLRQDGSMTLEQLQSVIDIQVDQLHALIRRGLLATDLNHPIGPKMRFHLGPRSSERLTGPEA